MFSRSKKELAPSPAHVRPRPPSEPPTKRLPEGAEAALWAIVEVLPDPRNHLALTRDPTCEVRLTPAQLAEARASVPTPPAAPAPSGSTAPSAPAAPSGSAAPSVPAARARPAPPASSTPAVAPPPSAPPLARRQRQIARRADVRWSEDTAEVRLPVIASPDELSATPLPAGDASVHTLDPPATSPDRWAEGA